MDSFKQALNHLKSQWQQSLVLGVISTALLFFAHYLPYIGGIFISFVLLLCQHIAEQHLQGKDWKDFSFLKKGTAAFVIVSIVLFPTSVLVGSSMGIIQGAQGLITAIPSAWGLLMVSIYFYLVLSHALRLRLDEGLGIAKAIDVAGLASLKKFKTYFLLSFYLSFLLVVSGFTWNVGLIITLPLLFYSSHFAFLEMKSLGLLKSQ